MSGEAEVLRAPWDVENASAPYDDLIVNADGKELFGVSWCGRLTRVQCDELLNLVLSLPGLFGIVRELAEMEDFDEVMVRSDLRTRAIALVDVLKVNS